MSRRTIVVAGVLVVVVGLVVLRALRGGGHGEEEIVTDVAVHVDTIARATLHRYVTAYGYVRPAPGRGPHPAGGTIITPVVAGVLREIDCVEGGSVKAGTVLFRLDSRLAQVALTKAQQELEFAQKAFDRQAQLLSADGTSQRAYEEAQQRLQAARTGVASARAELAYHNISAPMSGTVTRVNVAVGQSVDPGTELAEVVDMKRLVVAAQVPSREAAGLEVGQAVLIGPDSMPVEGTLIVLSSGLDPATGTYPVQASLPAGAGFTPGEFTSIRIVAEEHPDVLVVPEVSLATRAGEGSWIMVVEGDRAVRRPVVVGLRDRGLVEVSGEGLTTGMRIVTDDAYSLPEETKIHIVSPIAGG